MVYGSSLKDEVCSTIEAIDTLMLFNVWEGTEITRLCKRNRRQDHLLRKRVARVRRQNSGG